MLEERILFLIRDYRNRAEIERRLLSALGGPEGIDKIDLYTHRRSFYLMVF
jgi:hypothetical protein